MPPACSFSSPKCSVWPNPRPKRAASSQGSVITAKKDRESIFDFISDFAVVACDLQLILTLGNHAMILQLIKNYVMILQ